MQLVFGLIGVAMLFFGGLAVIAGPSAVHMTYGAILVVGAFSIMLLASIGNVLEKMKKTQETQGRVQIEKLDRLIELLKEQRPTSGGDETRLSID